MKGNTHENGRLLGDTWQLVHDPVRFNGYIETEVNKYQRGEHGGANSNSNNVPSPAPNQR